MTKIDSALADFVFAASVADDAAEELRSSGAEPRASKTLREAVDVMAQPLSELRAIEVPARLGPEHARLVATLTAFERGLSNHASSLRRGTRVARLATVPRGLPSEARRRLDKMRRSLSSKVRRLLDRLRRGVRPLIAVEIASAQGRGGSARDDIQVGWDGEGPEIT